jgi:hypothetical protein
MFAWQAGNEPASINIVPHFEVFDAFGSRLEKLLAQN